MPNDGRPAFDWHTPLVIAWRDERGVERTITVGLVETHSGGIQIGLVITPPNTSDDPVILPLEIANQVELNLRNTLVARFRRAIDGLDDEKP
ncbi:MAG TPA: hypothetical protein VGX25_12540 [Actinophytocola sp.]|uniref:hypothetical protein n=1 Tax=Actinophytocola sp. TaxID=1872138 RepID=UPI002DDD06BF|nr:hypothetical protein [Actinophytocola sp.]HEV2780212.1 hypothetical protein [Actinophytocola sp.]